MDYEEFKDELTKAGSKFDGHVTIGSLEEQLKVLRQYLGLEERKRNALPKDKAP